MQERGTAHAALDNPWHVRMLLNALVATYAADKKMVDATAARAAVAEVITTE